MAFVRKKLIKYAKYALSILELAIVQLGLLAWSAISRDIDLYAIPTTS